MPFEMATRQDWGSMTITSSGEPLVHPIMWVNIAHLCLDYKVPTIEIIRELQRQDLMVGRKDIQPNFLIANDGVVYEGRGWFIQPGNAAERPGKEGLFMDITFLGDLQALGEDYKHPVFRSLSKLLSIGVNKNYLSKTAKFLGPETTDPDQPKRLGFHGMPINMMGILPPAQCQEDVKRPELVEGGFGNKDNQTQ